MAYTGSSPGIAGSLSQFYALDYEKIFFDEYKRQSPLFPMLMNATKWEQYSVKEGSAMSFGSHVYRKDGNPIDFDVITQGPEKTVTFKDYALGYELTRNMAADDKSGHLKKIPKELAKSADYTIEVLCWDILNSGFVTTARTGIDAAALFASHTRIDGGTQSNLGAASVLNETSLEAMILNGRKMYNQRGQFTPIKYTTLWIPPELEPVAERLLMTEKRPGGMDNDVNFLNKYGLKYVVVPFLSSSSTTAWFATAEEHDLRLMWRDYVAFDSGDDIRTQNALFVSTFRLAVEFWDFRGAYGNAAA